MKVCSSCEVDKSLDEFDLHKSRPDGRTGTCKECRRLKYKTRYAANKNGIRDKHHRYWLEMKSDLARRADNKASARLRCQKSRMMQKQLPNYSEIKTEKNRARVLHKHGVAKAEYAQMETAQEKRCMICGGINKSGRKLAVDHCHTTGQIRSLLCSKCNIGIGTFDDKPERLIAAADYLRLHEAKRRLIAWIVITFIKIRYGIM